MIDIKIIRQLQKVKYISVTENEIITCRLVSSEPKPLLKKIQMTMK